MSTRLLKILILISVVTLMALFFMMFGDLKQEKGTASLTTNSRLQIREEFAENTIPNFQFTNQFGEKVTQAEFDGRIYVADFFFTTCPTICPAMAGNKIRIQEAFKDNSEVLILSHSIDTRSDSIPQLKIYAEHVGALKGKWHLVTGNKEKIYEIAKEYYVTAQEDDLGDASFVHDGSFILVDDKRHIRGIYDGTDFTSTGVLIRDIKSLLEK